MEDLNAPPGNRLEALKGERRGQYSIRFNDQWRGNRAITADTALRLGRYFGTSPELWLDRQSDYELRRARQATGKTIESQVQARVA